MWGFGRIEILFGWCYVDFEFMNLNLRLYVTGNSLNVLDKKEVRSGKKGRKKGLGFMMGLGPPMSVWCDWC